MDKAYHSRQSNIPSRRSVPDRRLLMTKIAIVVTAILLGFTLILIGAFVVLPRIISESTKMKDEDFALELYDKTLESPPVPTTAAAVPEPTVQPAFEQPKVSEEPAPHFPRDSFASVLEINEDIVGRIGIDDLGINYLVTQGTDNDYYLHMGYDRKKNSNGAIFLDYRCNIDLDPLKGHYILYGHNMKNGSMFHNLMQYKYEKFFNEHRIIRFDTLYEDHEWEIFSAYITDTHFYYIDTAFKDDADWLTFLQTVQGKSLFPTDTVLSADDVVLTLSTCTYEFDDARFVIHARLIK